MAAYDDLPVEIRDLILDLLPWQDVASYNLLGRFFNEHARTYFPLWRSVATVAQQSLTDVAYDLRVDADVDTLREVFLRLVGVSRQSIYHLISFSQLPASSTRQFLSTVTLMGVDLPRNQVALYFADRSVGIYSVAHITTDPPLQRFHLDERWAPRAIHLCDGNIVVEVNYLVDFVRTRSVKAIRFGTLDGRFYGGAIPAGTTLDRVVVNENYVVALVDYAPGTNRISGSQQVVVVPRVQGRYDGTRVVTQRAVGVVSLALDSTTLGLVTTHRSTVHRFYSNVALFAFDLGDPNDVVTESRLFASELGCVELLVNSFLLYNYELVVAHRLSSYHGAGDGTVGGLNSHLVLLNFVYSKRGYGHIYFLEWAHTLGLLEIHYVADGSGSLVSVFPRVFRGLNLPIPHLEGSMYFFVGHNLVSFATNHVFVQRLAVRRIERVRINYD